VKKPWRWPAILSAVLLIGLAASLTVGPVKVPLNHLPAILFASDPSVDFGEATIVRQLRLPRILLAALVGAGLGVAGAAYQGLFRNPLADPFIIGSSSGAALGATLAIVAGFGRSLPGVSPVAWSAFLGALLVVLATWSVANVGGRAPTLSLLLAGVSVSSFIGAVVSMLMFLNSKDLLTIFAWITGSLSGRGWTDLASAAPLILIGSALVLLCARALDALAFGEESAAALGLPLARLRGLVLVAASLTTAAAVAVGGVIGFVGLVAPHVARLLTGPRHACLIPTSALAGALLLLAADDLARTLVAPGEVPVGIVTALVGSPFLVYLLKRSARELECRP
jgi:iron complex transport system permease protein